jgi:hypothetical protein
VQIVGGEKMLEFIRMVLASACIASQIYPQRGNIYSLYITKISEIMKFHDSIYTGAKMFMDRKKAKFNDFLKRYSFDCPACE